MNAPEIHRIEKLFGLPSFVKKADFDDYTNPPPGPYQYADRGKQFPVHSKAACYISNARFWDSMIQGNNHPDADKISDSLIKSANFWGIQNDVKRQILTKIAQYSPVTSVQDLPDEAFLFVDGNIRLYPVLDPSTVKLAADKFYSDRHKLPFEQRKQIATKLYEKVASMNVYLDEEVEDFIERAACKGVSPKDTLVSALYKRAYIMKSLKDSETCDLLLKTSATIADQPLSVDLCEKVAKLLDVVDSDAKVRRHYGKEISPVEETCFKVLYKHAAEDIDKYVYAENDLCYRKEDLEKISADVFTKLGFDVSGTIGEMSMTKAASAVESMTPTQAANFDRLAEYYGVAPVEPPVYVKLLKRS